MTIFHDGCTAGPLSGWLDGMIGACCALHDSALDHGYDLASFIVGNWQFAGCIWGVHPWLAPIVFLMGLSRVEQGQHWFSDAMGGYVFGSLWLALTVKLYRWGKPRFFVRQPVAPPSPNLERDAPAG